MEDGDNLLNFSTTETNKGSLTVHLVKPKVHGTPQEFIHAKMIIADETVYVGSSNLTYISQIAQEELQLRIWGGGFADQMKVEFEHKKDYCEIWTPAEARRREQKNLLSIKL